MRLGPRRSKVKEKTSDRYSVSSSCCEDLSCRRLPTSQYQIVIGVIGAKGLSIRGECVEWGCAVGCRRVRRPVWSISYAEREKKCYFAGLDHCIDAEVGKMVLFLIWNMSCSIGDGNYRALRNLLMLRDSARPQPRYAWLVLQYRAGYKRQPTSVRP